MSMGAAPPEATPLPDVDEGPAPRPESSSALDLSPRRAGPSETAPADEAASPSPAPPAPKVDAASTPPLRVDYGLGPSAPGTADEQAWVDTLGQTLAATQQPAVDARLMPAGVSQARRWCREGDAQLVIWLDYLPDREAPVWTPYDCELEQALGVRAAEAARSPDWIGALWSEHLALAAQDGKKRRKGLAKGAKTALIVGGATIGVAGAVALILVNVLRPTSTVLKVRPE